MSQKEQNDNPPISVPNLIKKEINFKDLSLGKISDQDSQVVPNK